MAYVSREKRELLSDPEYQKLLLSVVVTSFGWWFTYIALFSRYVFEAAVGPIQVASLTIVSLLPSVVVSPASGTLADRFEKRRLLVFAEFAGAAFVTVILLYESLVVGYVFFFLLGASAELSRAVQRALLPQMVDQDRLLPANALLENTVTLARIGGPGLAGAVLAAAGTTVLFVSDIVSYVLAGVVLLTLGSYSVEMDAESTLLADFREGITYLKEAPTLRLAVGVGIFAYGGAGAYNAIVPLFLREVLQFDASMFGYLTLVTSLGAFVAGLVVAGYGDRVNSFAAVSICLFTVAASLFGLARLRPLPVIVVVVFLAGFGFSAIGIYCSTVIQQVSGESYVGRVMGLYRGGNKTGQVVAMGVAGVVTTLVGSVGLFVGVAGFFAVVGLWVGALVLRATSATQVSEQLAEEGDPR